MHQAVRLQTAKSFVYLAALYSMFMQAKQRAGWAVSFVAVLAGCDSQQPISVADRVPHDDRSSGHHAGVRDEELLSAAGSPLEKTLDTTFARLAASLAQQDASSVSAFLAPDRLIAEVQPARPAGGRSATERTALHAAVRYQAVHDLLQAAQSGKWDGAVIERVEVDAQSQRAAAVVRFTSSRETPYRIQFWLGRQQSAWRIYDWQMAGDSARVSAHLANSMAAFQGDLDAIYIQMLTIARRMVADGQHELADDFLQRIADIRFSPQLEAARWRLYARIQLSRGLAAEALDSLQLAQSQDPTASDHFLLQAEANYALGRWKESLEFARRAIGTLADQGQVYEVVGRTLRELGRPAEACAAFCNGLAADPSSIANLIGLAGIDSVEARSEFAARLGVFADPDGVLESVAQALVASPYAARLKDVVAAMRKHQPQSLLAEFYAAEARMLDGDFEAAAALLSAMIPRTGSPLRARCEDRLLDALLAAGKPLAAYEAAADSDLAFGHLAAELHAKQDAATLLELVDLHRQRSPHDIRLLFYAGRAWQELRDFAQASVAFAEGLARAQEPVRRQRFRSELVRAQFQQGKALEAYRQLAPKRAVFDQLAKLLAAAEDAAALEALLAAHREQDPDDPTLTLWQGEVRWLQGDYEGLVQLFAAQREIILADPDNRDRFEDRIIRGLIRLGRYYEALHMAKASSAQDGDPWFEALVHAVAGNVDQTDAVLQYCRQLGYRVSEFHDDPDLGPALRSDALAALRSKYPAPAEEETDEEIITIIP